MGRLMAHYKWTFDYVYYELPMVQGWVWYAFAMETDGWLNFGGVKRGSDGYIKQEKDILMQQARKAYGWKD